MCFIRAFALDQRGLITCDPRCEHVLAGVTETMLYQLRPNVLNLVGQTARLSKGSAVVELA